MASRIATLAVLFLAAAGIAPALAADPAGVAVSVNQNANAAGTGGSRVLSTNGSIFTGDRITTDGKGEAQLHFMDDTRMIVGPNSNIAIDKFVVTGPANAQNVTIDVAKGAFRFITGNAPKSAYTINTPVATISVRGTMFDFTSGPNGGALFIYRDTKTGGASDVTYCDTTTAKPTCFEVNDDCTLVTFPPRGRLPGRRQRLPAHPDGAGDVSIPGQEQRPSRFPRGVIGVRAHRPDRSGQPVQPALHQRHHQ